MTDLDNFTSITKLPADATLADAVAKINEVVAAVNLLVPRVNGTEGEEA